MRVQILIESQWRSKMKSNLRMHNLLTLARFNMLELVVAMVIGVVGMVTITNLLPVALEANQAALGRGAAGDAAEQFLRINANKLRRDWTWANVFSTSKPDSSEPSLADWSSQPVYRNGNIQISSERGLDSSLDDNSGFFLLERFSNGMVDFKAVLRIWKDVTESEDGSIDYALNVEISWPQEVPYSSSERKKETFILQVQKAPEITFMDAIYENCEVTRDHDGGFTSTIVDVVANMDSTYTISLNVDYDGCTSFDCQQLTEYTVEADPNYKNVILNGDGTSNSFTTIASADTDQFSGFNVILGNGIGGNGVSGSFSIEYTVPGLQNQQVALTMGSSVNINNFDLGDFEYVTECTGGEQQEIVEANIFDPECEGNDYPVYWPNENFSWTPTSGTITTGTYFCKPLGTGNNPIDPDGKELDELNVSVCDGPSWLYWNPNIQQIAGTPDEAGTFTWKLCVDDGCHSAETEITFTVNP